MTNQTKLLFSVTKKDLVRQTFCSGGNGGSKRNATKNGVRFIHEASGARGQASDARGQAENERNAFRRLVESQTFRNWHRVECARLTRQEPAPETEAETWARVDRMIEDGIQTGQITIEETDLADEELAL